MRPDPTDSRQIQPSRIAALPFFATRRFAHAQIVPTKAQMYARILGFARDRGSRRFTADELAAAWGCAHNHTSPRVTELVKSGELVATDRRRRTRSGKRGRVFVPGIEIRKGDRGELPEKRNGPEQ